MSAKMAPIIGGPLNGRRANYASFRGASQRYSKITGLGEWIPVPPGDFYPWAEEYIAYNAANRPRAVTRWPFGAPSMIWVHRELLP